MIDLSNADERAAAAGEYVLGTLGSDDHASFSRALELDAALHALVYGWQDRLLGLTSLAAAAQPAPSVWARIQARIQASAVPHLPHTPAAPRAALPPWWQRLGLWQGLSGLALAASVVMALLLVQRELLPAPSGERYLAVLQSPNLQTTGWVVEIESGRNLRLVPVLDMPAVAEDRALQFWTKPQGAAGPTSLGLVRAGQTVVLPASALPGLGTQQLFEITLEPRNGSPIGRPTGPILFVGKTVRL